ncbi:MAG: DUF2971 domain-containing protein [Candidatus Thiodiazotropha sp.]
MSIKKATQMHALGNVVFDSLSYFERRVILSRMQNNDIPRFMYKYRSINISDKKSIDKIREIIVWNEVWLSSPHNFNDPFDMRARFIFDGTIKDKIKTAKQLAKLRDLNYKQTKVLVSNVVRETDEDARAYVEKSYYKQMKNMGVASFTGDPKSVLMWSHYSHNHTGICIQYEVVRDFTFISNLGEVKYYPDYPVFNWINSTPQKLHNILLHKYEGWKYEKEYRMVLIDRADKPYKLNNRAITGIIFGCKASDEIIKKVLEIIKEREANGNPPINLYRAVQHKSQYAVSIHRY